MMPLRAAMPSTVTKPTSEPSDSTPPVRNAPTTPPTSANGSVSATSARQPHRAEVDVQQQQDAEQRERAESRAAGCCDSCARRVLAEELRVVARASNGTPADARLDLAGDARRGRGRATLQVTSIRREPPSRLISFGRRHDRDVGHVAERHVPPPRRCRSAARASATGRVARAGDAPDDHVEDLLLLVHLADLRAPAAAWSPRGGRRRRSARTARRRRAAAAPRPAARATCGSTFRSATPATPSIAPADLLRPCRAARRGRGRRSARRWSRWRR